MTRISEALRGRVHAVPAKLLFPRVTQSGGVVSDRHDDACCAAARSDCPPIFSHFPPAIQVVTSVAPATSRAGSIIDGFRHKSKQVFLFCPMRDKESKNNLNFFFTVKAHFGT